MKAAIQHIKQWGIVGITGGAGAGKSTLAQSLARDGGFVVYSSDYRFFGDSKYRENLLKNKLGDDARLNLASYIDACNQFNWWNWDAIYQDLVDLINNKTVVIEGAYSRDTGKNDGTIVIQKASPSTGIIYEGAILGPTPILNLLQSIYVLQVSAETRLKRLLFKDADRRTVNNILARFMITNYSEHLYSQSILNKSNKGLYYLNENLDFTNKQEKKDDYFIPIKMI